MRYLLDTDILINILRGNRDLSLMVNKWGTQGHLLAYTPINKAEVYAGLRPQEELNTQALFHALQSLPVIDLVGEKAGEYLRTFSKSHGLEIADALIAASAFHYSCCLVTLNRKHYPMKDVEIFPL